MRNAFLHGSCATGWAGTITSTVSTIVYRLMSVTQALSPYLFAALLVIGLQNGTAHAASPAEAFVQDNIQKGYAIVNDTTLDPVARGNKFRALLSGIMDSKRIAVFTLGPAARTASPAQLDDFADGFSDFVTSVLQHDLAGNPGESFTITGSVVHAPDDVIVNGKLTGSSRSNGQPVNIGFRIRKTADGNNTVVDLLVEGVSMALTQRSDFTSWLQQHHGDVPALGRELRARARQFREDDLNPQTAAEFHHGN